MFKLQFQADSAPVYMTEHAAAADLLSAQQQVIPAGSFARIATGVSIKEVLWDQVPKGFLPELQIRARSGLAFKHGLTMLNGVGTIDADYRDEIGVLLWNTSRQDFIVEKGSRIAQLVCALVCRLPELEVKGDRQGGFGSTGH